MNFSLTPLTHALHTAFAAAGGGARRLVDARRMLFTAGIAAAGAWVLIAHPPVDSVPAGDIAVRTNQFSGDVTVLGEGSALRLPALHALRHFTLRDQVVRPAGGRKAAGPAPFQSVEGLSIGVDLSVRYAVDPAKVAQIVRKLPNDLDGEVVEPAVQAVIYKTFARYTVREIFSSKRAEIQQAIETELRAKLAADGIVLQERADRPGRPAGRLPARHGPPAVGGARGREDALHARAEGEAGQADRARSAGRQGPAREGCRRRRQRAGHRRARAGRGDAPRAALQAEADRAAPARGRGREGQRASSRPRPPRRRAASRPRARPTRARSWPMPRSTAWTASAGSTREQMAREGALLSRHPLLIQKTLADKLSDKVQVIIAPPGTDGGFIASGLIGKLPEGREPAAARSTEAQ